jgi:hypothetical protein
MILETDYQAVEELEVYVPFYKNKITISFISAICLIILTGAFLYSIQLQKKAKNEIITTLPKEEKIDISNWNTYTNKEYGFKFSYPSIASTSEGITLLESEVYDLQVPYITLITRSESGIAQHSGLLSVSITNEQRNVDNPYKVTLQTQESLKDYEKAIQDSIVYMDIGKVNHKPIFFENILKNTNDWITCENQKNRIRLKLPKEFGCSEINYNREQGIFISMPKDFEWKTQFGYGEDSGGILILFQDYNYPDTETYAFGKCADENGCDSISISNIISNIRQNTNITVDSFPALYQKETDSSKISTGRSTYELDVDLPGRILHIETDVRDERASAASKRLNLEFEEILKMIISSIKIL